jgi:hypothetical protein
MQGWKDDLRGRRHFWDGPRKGLSGLKLLPRNQKNLAAGESRFRGGEERSCRGYRLIFYALAAFIQGRYSSFEAWS